MTFDLLHPLLGCEEQRPGKDTTNSKHDTERVKKDIYKNDTDRVVHFCHAFRYLTSVSFDKFLLSQKRKIS